MTIREWYQSDGEMVIGCLLQSANTQGANRIQENAQTKYRIAGNFGEVFNLANWRFYGKSPNLKSAIFYSDEI